MENYLPINHAEEPPQDAEIRARWTKVLALIKEMESKHGGRVCAPGQDAVSLLRECRRERDFEILGYRFDDDQDY